MAKRVRNIYKRLGRNCLRQTFCQYTRMNMKMKKYNKILLGILILIAIALIPSLVAAYYVPVDDDEYPDNYSVVRGANASGDLEDVCYNDGDNFTLDSEYAYSGEQIDIRFHFYYDLWVPDSDYILVEFGVSGDGSGPVDISAYGDESGWINLGSKQPGEHELELPNSQGITKIRFYRYDSGIDDFEIQIDRAILEF